MKKPKIRYAFADTVYYGISGFFLLLLSLMIAYPLIFVVSASFSSGAAILAGQVTLFPVDISIEGYKAIFAMPSIFMAYMNTIWYTVLGTIINVGIALIAAYPLSMKDLKGRGFFMLLFTFTMFFSGGLVPTYILIKELGMIDTTWAMVVPGALSVYYLIITRTFFQTGVPQDLYEASHLDGCSDAKYFFLILLPLSKAIIAVLTMFAAVGHWNAYFNALIYLNNRAKMPLQVLLRDILVVNQIDPGTVTDPELLQNIVTRANALKYALIVVCTGPILCVYPFAQKHFVKGVMIGSLKG